VSMQDTTMTIGMITSMMAEVTERLDAILVFRVFILFSVWEWCGRLSTPYIIS
jgi:hypothetical protein